MRLIWTPEDGERREFVFRPGRLMSVEAEAVEDATGWTFDEFGERFLRGSAKARRAALWVMLRREQPTLRFRDLAVRVDEVTIDFETEEAAQAREAIAAEPDMDEQQREYLLGLLDTPKDVPAESGTPDAPTGGT